MPASDLKITALTALTAADPANDVLPIVDVSDNSMAASGTTKKISINNILACSPTATLASATITGGLTVQSNVNAPANVSLRYGPSGATWAGLRFDATNQTFLDSDIALSFRTGGATSFTTAYTIGATGISTWSVGGTTAMTLNANGLFLGISSQAFAEKFRVYGSYTLMDDGAFTGFLGKASSLGVSGATTDFAIRSSNALIFLSGGATERMRIDSSGNLGIGVTPSAWNSTFKGLDISTGGAIAGSSDSVRLFSNSAFNTAGNNVYKNAATAGRYDIQGNVHTWNISTNTPSVGGVITFSPAMTLDASGNLIVNGTTQFAKISSYVTSSGTFQSALGATNGANSDFVVRIKTSVSDVYNSVGSITLSTGGSGGTERVRVKDSGQVRFVPLAADPAGAEAGDVYYNSVSNRLKYYNGTAWTLI